jgi:RNA polymerase sigma-70 factor, ECF subfamily
LKSLTDAQLVAMTQDGNMGAFNSLTARWESSLYRFVHRLLGDPEEARDVCQEALLKAYLNIAKLRDGEKFKAWIHHIALNLCRDRFRSPRARAEVRSYEEEGIDERRVAVESAAARSAGHHAERIGMMAVLEQVFEDIPVEQRSAILLREYHGFTTEEIGEISGVPAATVRTRIFYGLRSVRKLLRERGFETPASASTEGGASR